MCAAGVACSCVQLVWSVHVCSWCGLSMCAAGVVCSCVQLVWPVHVCSWCGLSMCAAGVVCSCVQLVWSVRVCSWCGLFVCAAGVVCSCVHKVCGLRAQELCESGGGRPGFLVTNSPYGLCGSKATLNLNSMWSGLRSGVAVLDSPVPTVPMVFVDVKRRLKKKVCGQLVSGNA